VSQNHDALATAVAQEITRQTLAGLQPWATVFSPQVHLAGSHGWPVPDFVLMDHSSQATAAGEFKPPDQTKREYLTGLGQATSFTQGFDYSLLVVPDLADDGFPIADYLNDVLSQEIADDLPVGLVKYDARRLSTTNVALDVLRPLSLRAQGPTRRAPIASSFYAKWREASPMEIGRFVEYLFQEGRTVDPNRTVRDRAFDRLWIDMTAGRTMHWQGSPRRISNTPRLKTAWAKNYRNFLTHLSWIGPDGKLTEAGLHAHRIVYLYDAASVVFTDELARSVLENGKHLVLINAINTIQDSGVPPTEPAWLTQLEQQLENDGLIERNPGRRGALAQRQFLKAEKQLWRNLGLIVPNGARVFHKGRGFIFDWDRITALVGA
jgi:hypothetical protein